MPLSLTTFAVALTLTAMPAREIVLKQGESVTLSDGAVLTFRDYTVEEISASPSDPKSYPAGSGVTFVLQLKRGERTEPLHLTELSPGYTSQRTAEALGWKVEFVSFSGALTPGARLTLRVAPVR